MVGKTPNLKAITETVDVTNTFTNPLPDSWEQIPLERAVELTKQVDPTRRPEWKFKYVDVSSVSNESLDIRRFTEYLGADAPGRARKAIEGGDVIFATVRPSLKRIAIVPSELHGQICSTAFCVIRADPKIADPSFLFYAVSNDDFVKRVAANEKGVSYPAVTDKVVLHEAIALPPLPEQREISRVLSAIRSAQHATREVLDATRELKKTMIVSLLRRVDSFEEATSTESGNRVEIDHIPDGWELVPIQNVFRFTTKPHDLILSDTPLIPFLPMEKIPIGTIFVSDYEMRKPEEIASGTYFEEDDLLLAKITPSFENGKQAVAENLPGKFGVATTEVIPIKGIPGKSEILFLHYYLQRSDVRAGLAGKMTGTTGRQRLDKHVLESYLILMPPLPEQRRIATYLKTIDEKIIAEERCSDHLRDLYRTLLHELLSGRIRLAVHTVAGNA